MVISEEIEKLALQVGADLAARGWMVATAESCTGGLVSAAITEIAGSSGWFDRGFVTYSNHAKMDLLGVPADTLDQHGAVSEATAAAMALGALAHSRARVSLSITGIAGPGGGGPGKPVGTVCFGWAQSGQPAQVATCLFVGDRAAVRRQSVVFALRGLRERLLEA